MAQAPRIICVAPDQVQPGDTLTVTGSGFKRGDRVELWDALSGDVERKLTKRFVKRLSAEELEITLPKKISAGPKRLAILRGEQRHMAEVTFTVAPQISELLVQRGTEITIRGQGFAAGSRVLMGEVELIPTRISPTRLTVTLPQDIPLADVQSPRVLTPQSVAPPEGLRELPAADVVSRALEALPSEARPALAIDLSQPARASSGFHVRRDGFSFANDVSLQAASWSVFAETFGADNIKAASRFSTFIFLWAYYALYTSFFEGVGVFQASGLCTGLAALALERFCYAESSDASPNFALEPTPEIRRQLTVRMGRILGREQLTEAYEQCKRGLANVAPTLSALQASLQGAPHPDTAQLLWFLPSGRITERKFLEKLSAAHSVVPYAFYDERDGNVSRWRILIYDVNMPGREDVWVDVEQQEGDRWWWRHNRDPRFSSETGMTLAAMPLQLFLQPADFPFSGPFGLTRFLFDMLL